jgi:hypothetical protein
MRMPAFSWIATQQRYFPSERFVGLAFFALLGQAHDELKSEFIVAATTIISHGWICLSTTLTEPWHAEDPSSKTT